MLVNEAIEVMYYVASVRAVKDIETRGDQPRLNSEQRDGYILSVVFVENPHLAGRRRQGDAMTVVVEKYPFVLGVAT